MTSDKAKQERLKASRLKRAKALAGIDTCDPAIDPPPGAVMADQRELAHNNTYGLLPRFYVDKWVVCRQCGMEEVWPAERQKWWYEVAKGNINTQAVLCRSCRGRKRRGESTWRGWRKSVKDPDIDGPWVRKNLPVPFYCSSPSGAR